jgi:16S rRNA (cytidine1402-2'-O)-methyltransferase
LEILIVENVKTASRFLQWVGDTVPEYEIEYLLLNKDTSKQEIESFLDPLLNGQDVGLMSEAGTPVIADPGSSIITRAHQRDIEVVPLTGPSSIFLALMASGYNGQAFTFTGYLPLDDGDRRGKLSSLEKESRQKNRTILFMETPYRNNELLQSVLDCCSSDTYLCVAASLTLPSQTIISAQIHEWKSKKSLPDLNKKPAIFLLYAGNPGRST